MAAPTQFTLNWSPNLLATSQTVKYRQSGTLTWTTSPNITAANPQDPTATSAVIANQTFNTVYEFQVDANCSGTINSSNIYQMTLYTQQAVTDSIVARVISVNQNPMPSVGTIDYRLVSQQNVVLQNIQATGVAPNAAFAPVSSGNYTVQYRYGAIVNGVSLYSDDSTQQGDWYTTGTITVP